MGVSCALGVATSLRHATVMSKPATAYFSHPNCLSHDMGDGHPEQPARIATIEASLKAEGVWDRLLCRIAPPATRAHLQRAHSAAHLDRLAEAAPRPGAPCFWLDGDTALNTDTLDAAAHAAGAVVAAVDAVLGGEARTAFCNVRPPGHHAERDRAMGFCFYNNVAVAALHALDAHRLQRVAIIDFDVHYGNGTADIVGADPRVLLCMSYQWPLYPLPRPAPAAPRQSNILLPPGTDGAAFRTAVDKTWLPALRAFAPQLVLFSAGFDAHDADPLAELAWHEDDFAWVTRAILSTTRSSAAGRAVSTLEGGYDLPALGRAAAAHVRALMDAPAVPAAISG